MASCFFIGDLDTEISAVGIIGAQDEYYASSFHFSVGTIDDPGLPASVQLMDPTYTVSPSVGAVVGAQGPTFEFEPTAGAHANEIELWDSVTERSWIVSAPGNQTRVTLPVIPGYTLVPGREYLWRVSSAVAPGFDIDRYQDDALLAELTDFTTSWWDWFNTE